ncbi:hypothetical protein [Streptomyces sp. S.PB5]|uniref:hypothetical protein n=1 Tax=Streptomyces sp. S.PB5 TaxID=3020844 RepID=UPI0025AF6E5F|nr:hypothetical protein [Streptomyces sp. S.PB5]MDN3027873.1 hypothetical protein [Streptomyces sp. S.PB5]
MSDWCWQETYGVRFEWGPSGAQELARGAACLVVVDVLSFSTSVTVAVEAGTEVFPHPWREETAAALAVGRRAATPESPWSLSPAGLRRAPFTPWLVLPWLAGQGYGTPERPVAVIGAGERRLDGTLRPALEDLLHGNA